MTLDKLKVAARQHEQREEWRAAIELYREAIRAGEEASEGTDPYLYSRIGDLEQKDGNARAACEAWELAVARYGDLGFSNNAIAICAKVLRLDPARTRIYLELARYEARKGMFHDATRDLRTYHDRMHRAGHDHQARGGLEALGLEFPTWPELQAILDDLLGGGRPEAESAPIVEKRMPEGKGLVFIDVEPLSIERASDGAAAPAMVVEPTAFSGSDLERPGDITLDGLEPNAAAPTTQSTDSALAVDGLIEMQRLREDLDPGLAIEGLEQRAEPLVMGKTAPVEGLEPVVTSETSGATTDPGIVFLETGTGLNDDSAAPTAAEERAIPTASDDDPLGQRAMGHALLEIGDRVGGIAAFARALSLYQADGDWAMAWQAASELVEAEPQHIGHHQARVEIASMLHDPLKRTDAYLDLGDALRRAGSDEKAIAVFRRVLEHVADQPRAVAALRGMRPEPAAEPKNDGFIDLREMLVDDGPRSTRMRTETTPVLADEDETFREALAEFKRALDENLPLEDSQAHYDLGVAFREMGLLDEAIGSFQKALRSPDARLRTSEALGQTFFEQGRVAVAEAVLRNAERGPEDESAKIGVLYWLGRALEAQDRPTEALDFYQRILAVDVFFMDVSDRMRAVAELGRK